jgi:hypothetical protein
MSMPSPVRRHRRSTTLGLLSALGLGGCTSSGGPRLVPLPAVSRSQPQPLSQRRTEREALLRAARERLIGQADPRGQLATRSALGDRIRSLAAPLQHAARALRAEAPTSDWPIDVLAGEPSSEAADVIPLLPVSLVIVLPANHPIARSDDVLSALIAHGLAHGLRDHALETEVLKDGLPWFSPIEEREADRDTCEILARAGLDPLLAWRLRSAWRTERHPEPPRARQAIESFSARVESLRAVAAAVR